ncbi:serine/threonine-protein kinase [Nocardiopsis sp. NPDC006139]|uniref:serine/threonine-protein kinase n=1 Tax=Nocardiopsis sp. NPDC006139 TaxID=3154578 RepID=UPI0033A84528
MVDIGSEVGGYRLRRLLGAGGFGTVYLGEHRDGHRAAVKVLHVRHRGDADFRERFDREIGLIKSVLPFCTARVLDADPGGDPPWIATEYVEGTPLEGYIRGRGPGSDGDLYRLAVSTATALVAIHRAGVVHRDFKPDNILLGRDGVRVIDFGISRALEGTGTSASAILGTPKYMAPEQFGGGEVTTAIDMFAWGLVMVFAATGRGAFEAPNMPALLMRVTTGEPDLDGVPETLLPLVRRCLDREPRNRPTARDVLMALLGHRDDPGAGEEGPGAGPDAARPATRLMSAEEIAAVLGAEREAERGAVDADGGDTTTIRVPVEEIAAAAAEIRKEPPFRFDGVDHTSPVSLAYAFQERWDTAVGFLRSPEQRRRLAQWPPLDAAARDLLADAPASSGDGAGDELLLARVVARMAPALRPSYRGEDLSLHLLVDGAGDPVPFLAGIAGAIRAGLLRTLSRHHCRTPEAHGCGRGTPCARYARTAENLHLLMEAVDAQREWNAPFADAFPDGGLLFSPPLPRLVALAHGAAAAPVTDRGELAALAARDLDPENAELRVAVREAVLMAAPEAQWALAVTLREASPQLNLAARTVRGMRAPAAPEEGAGGVPREGGLVRSDPDSPDSPAARDARDDNVFFYAGMSVLLFVFAGVALLLDRTGVAAVLGAVAAVAAGAGAATMSARSLRSRRARRDRARDTPPGVPPAAGGPGPVEGDASAALPVLEQALRRVGGRAGEEGPSSTFSGTFV